MQEGRVFVVSVSGVIGTGKSTLLKRLSRSETLQRALTRGWMQSHAGCQPPPLLWVVREPVKEWMDHGWLEQFYGNMELNALAFQLLVVDSRIRAMQAAIAEARAAAAGTGRDIVLLSERCKYDDRLFWTQQAASAFHSEAYVCTWTRWSESLPETALIFLLHTRDIQHTMRRMRARKRAEELRASFSSSAEDATATQADIAEVGGVTTTYQEQLMARHFAWFAEPVAQPPGAPAAGIPCVHLSADAPYHEDDGTLDEMARIMAAHILRHVYGLSVFLA